MSRLSYPTQFSEVILTQTRDSPVNIYNTPIHRVNTSSDKSQFKEKKKKPYLLDLPNLQIKKSKTLSINQLSESTKAKSSPYSSEVLQLQSTENLVKLRRKIKTKKVSFPTENFIQVIEIESFKKLNFMEEIKPKEYDIYNKKCCVLF